MTAALIALSVLLAASLVANYYLAVSVSDGLDRLSEPSIEDGLTQSDKAYIDRLIEESEKEDEDEFVRVAIDTESNRAYWITDKGLMFAEVNEDGRHNYSSGKVVDTHSMSTKELATIIEIVDALKEQSDEGSGSGD